MGKDNYCSRELYVRLFKHHFQSLFQLAFPLILTGLLQSSVYFFITMFLAHVDQDALAAGSLVAWLFGTFNVIVIGVLNATNILIAHRHGAHDAHGVSLVFRDGFWLACILAIPSFFSFGILPPYFCILVKTKH